MMIISFFLSVTACQEHGTIMILSTISTSSIEEVAAAAPLANKWFQLYIYKDRTVTRSLISRAEKAGFRALVLTVDTPFFGTRHADVRNKFCLPPHLSLANLNAETVPQMKAPGSQASGLNEYATSLFDPSLTWKDVQWLKSITRLPIIVKGILTAEDAVTAVQNGVSGIIVSNHGARQLDHVSATVSRIFSCIP
jgi:(S)-2-hydroxy-acid oxidase